MRQINKFILSFSIAFFFFFIALVIFFQYQIKATLFLLELIPNNLIKPLSWVTSKPTVTQVSYKTEKGEQIYADLWLPKDGGESPGMVLHLGVDIDKTDPRAQQMANAMARLGIATLVPNLNSLHKRRVLETSKQELISAHQFLSEHKNIDSGKTGFVAFCASAGLAAVAGGDIRISQEIEFLFLVNPYYDFANIYSAITTHTITNEGKSLAWQPHFKTVEIYNREAVNILTNESEREILWDILVRRKPTQLEARDFGELSQEQFTDLSREGKNTYMGLTSQTPEEAKLHFDQRTSDQERFRLELSPATFAEEIKARTFIVADTNNVYIPFTEAKELHQSVRGSLFLQTSLVPAGEFNQKLKVYQYPVELWKALKFTGDFLKSIGA